MDCQKPRCVYTASYLQPGQDKAIQCIREADMYLCGTSLQKELALTISVKSFFSSASKEYFVMSDPRDPIHFCISSFLFFTYNISSWMNFLFLSFSELTFSFFFASSDIVYFAEEPLQLISMLHEERTTLTFEIPLEATYMVQ